MSFREKILSGVAAQACRHAKVVILVGAVLTAGSLVVIVLRGRISTNVADILPEDSEEATLFVEATEGFAADFHLIALEADDPADIQAAKPYADLLAENLRATTEFVTTVQHKVGEEVLGFAREIAETRGYLFLDETDIGLVRGKISPEAIRSQMAENRRRLEAAGIEYFKGRIVPDPLDLASLLGRHRIQVAGRFSPREGEEYVVSPDGTMLLMIVWPKESANDLAFDRAFMAEVARIERETWDELAAGEAGAGEGLFEGLRKRVRVGNAAGYAFAVEQNDVLTEDIQLTAVTSLVGVLLLFAFAFKRLGALLYIGTPLVASILWTVAVAFLVFDRISVMSGGFAAILIGLSVDYAIHIYNRYVSERGRGLGMEQAIGGAIVHSGSGIFFGALTTAVAFFAIAFTRFVGLSEFGVLAGVGVVLGMVAMLFLQPAILVVRNRIREEPLRIARVFGFGLTKLADLIERHPWKVFALSTLVALAAGGLVYAKLTVFFFDSDLKKLRAESRVFDLQDRVQKKFATNLGGMIALSRGATEDEALSNAARVLSRAQILLEGEKAVEVPWPGRGDGTARTTNPAAGTASREGLSPWVVARGCKVRLRSAEIVLPEGSSGPPGLAEGVERYLRPDGKRALVYDFRDESVMADWDFEGDHFHLAGVDMEPCTIARWKHAVAGEFTATFSLWFQGDTEGVTLGAGDGLSTTLDRSDEHKHLTQWPPRWADQLRFTLTVDPGRGATLHVGRGTLVAMESVAPFLPTVTAQKASAAFVASIDVDRVERDIAAAARERKIAPRAFRKFVRQLGGMVGRAKSPEFLTPEEVRASEVGALLTKYFGQDESAPPGSKRRHTVATYLYPERGEMDREWFNRVRRTLGDSADVTATRLVSLEARDIVWNDFSWIMTFVVVGVVASLVWSFKSVFWPLPALMPLVSAFAMLLATLLLLKHQLNLINVLIFPAIVGIGIDNAIHVIHRFRESGRVREIITETGRALLLTSLTTMIGFGSLMVSRYRGLCSLGFVAALGMFFCLYSSLVTLPSLLGGVASRRAQKAAGSPATEDAGEAAVRAEGRDAGGPEKVEGGPS